MRKIIQYTLKLISKLVLWKYKPFVIAITGSVGKSSTKEAIFKVMDYSYPGRVRKNKYNLNTEIGVPLTIIGGADAKRSVWMWIFNFIKGIFTFVFPGPYPRILVLEMAADRPGDLKYLTSIVKPDVSVVTAIGEMPVHLEFFSSRQEYIKEKSEVVANLKSDGVAILNYDDEDVRGMKELISKDQKIVFYGLSSEADLAAFNINFNLPRGASGLEETSLSFKVDINGSVIPIKVNNVLGRGLVYASLASLGVGKELGVSFVRSSEALKELEPLEGRMNLKKGIKNTILIDDTYNASPLSMIEALNVLGEFKNNRKIAVIGDMRELGENTKRAHKEIGKLADEVSDELFLIGSSMVFAREVSDRALWFKSGEESVSKLKEVLREGDVVLVKGSRAVNMDKVVRAIK